MAPSKADLAWFACFIDSEGFMVASVTATGAQCGISNSDPDMLRKAEVIMSKLGVRYGVHKHNKVNRQVYQIRVTNKKSLVILLTKLLPFLLRLNKKAKLILRYYGLRSARIGYNAKRTTQELNILRAVRAA